MRAYGRGKQWPLLRRWKTIDGTKRQELARLFAVNRRLFKASVLREQLDRLWTYTTRAGVARRLFGWLEALRWHRLPEMENLGDTLVRHFDGIAAPVTIRSGSASSHPWVRQTSGDRCRRPRETPFARVPGNQLRPHERRRWRRTAGGRVEESRVRWRGHRGLHQRAGRREFPRDGRDHCLVQSRSQHRPRERAEIENHPCARARGRCAGDRTSA
jgi:Transposase